MTKLGAIEFDDCILDSLRNDQLVVFAGAGVSMGPPSNLASFWKLTCDIAKGTGLTPTEPLDRFLGQLHHSNVSVHERAAQLLSPEGSVPNELHHNLLRLFRTADNVKLVTTNFDLHFETAARTLFGSVPKVYQAPALPLGYDFSGIVHIHGALPQARELVLTDADFGRAYLTEGWARRFLVDVFRKYTVLFVGYSHNDVVMNYLARALPADSIAGRFALTDEDGSWELLGIKPIRFLKGTGDDAYKELFGGLQKLAERVARGALDWQSRLAELGARTPPTDEEAISEVEQALREVHTTRFLLNVARYPEWLNWLHGRKHLDSLFGTADLGELDILLGDWVVQNFAIEHPYEVFHILSAHGLRMNPSIWNSLGRKLGAEKNDQVDEAVLKRWVTILLATTPAQADRFILMWLAERCASQGCFDLTLKMFMAMSEHQLILKPSFLLLDEDGSEHQRLNVECSICSDHWSLDEIWTKHLKPQLCPQIAQQLLSGIVRCLEEMHSELAAWDNASREWDPISYGRAAIEPHEQDEYPESVDVLIDAARDTLEWLASNYPMQLAAWIERLVSSDAPLLRRLAIHAITVHPMWSPQERLKWLLARIGLHEIAEYHEVHRAVALSYSTAANKARKIIIEAIMDHELPASDDWSAEMRTARLHFNWLSWLLLAKPNCKLAGTALEPIKAQYPDWQPSDYPDLTHWTGTADWVGSECPWSIEQLLVREPLEQLEDLQSFMGNSFDGPSREGLLANVREACKQSSSWAFALGRVLAERDLWSSDLWPPLIRGLQESELSSEGWSDLLIFVSNPVLQSAYAYDIANLLYALVKDGGKTFALDLLEEANAISLSVWQVLEANAQDDDIDDWLTRAINRPAGVIVEFWLHGLSLFMHGKTGPERFIPDDYRYWFTLVVQDETSKGGMGRSVLTSQTAFLFGLDEVWTCQHIIPLFSDSDRKKFAQAWDGFLMLGRLYPALVDALLPAFVAAIQRIATDDRRRKRFIEFYTRLAVFHVSDPTQSLLPVLFQQGTLEDRLTFASHLGYFLRQMQQTAKRQLWNGWLRRYWLDRLQGVLDILDDDEIQKMLEWLPHLGDAFPEAVALVVRCPVIRIEHTHVLYELRNSELVTQFAAETAELLIYLASCLGGYHARYLEEINARLPLIPEQVRIRVDEAFARAGVLRG
ncbi:DUF4020 domain-containing protein [Vibrio fluvialis]|nr:DUF4020 domain-containing protein [Vibrio fluvialis]